MHVRLWAWIFARVATWVRQHVGTDLPTALDLALAVTPRLVSADRKGRPGLRHPVSLIRGLVREAELLQRQFEGTDRRVAGV